jgi:hypothetical protein
MSRHPGNNEIVSKGGGGIRWPWDSARDVNIGSGSRTENSTVNLGSPARVQNSSVNTGSTDRVENSTVGGGSSAGSRRAEQRRARHARSDEAPESTGWRGFLVTVVVMAAFVFHALPHAAQSIAGLSPNAVRGLLAAMGGVIPVFEDFDAARWLVPAASAWLWQPFFAVLLAGLLRIAALNTAKRAPLAAIWAAAAALLVDAATWMFVGLRLWGEAYSAAEGEALIALLKVEAGALLVLFFLLAPTARKQRGRHDAVQGGDN